jgi:hypothetical protein
LLFHLLGRELHLLVQRIGQNKQSVSLLSNFCAFEFCLQGLDLILHNPAVIGIYLSLLFQFGGEIFVPFAFLAFPFLPDLIVFFRQFGQLSSQFVNLSSLLIVLLLYIFELLLQKQSLLDFQIAGESIVLKLLQSCSQLFSDVLRNRTAVEVVVISVWEVVERS